MCSLFYLKHETDEKSTKKAELFYFIATFAFIMKIRVTLSSEQLQNKQDSGLIRYFDLFSSIATESFYVLDLLQKQFCYVKTDNLFLSGFSLEEALNQGIDFYAKIIYHKDLSSWTEMRKAVLRYLKDFENELHNIDFFSCKFRLQRNYSFSPPRSLPQMVYHRMKPVLENEEWRYLICSVKSSTAKKPGNLCVYYKDGPIYKEYNLTSKRWQKKTKELLSEREKAILMLALQGKNTREIADCICKGQSTIQNQIKTLFDKLNVHSMQEAVELARNRRMVFPKQDTKQQATEPLCEKKRTSLTKGMVQRIQQYLNEEISIRQAARKEGIIESAVRYWIKKGKITIPKEKNPS